jgi:hypothetical protein
MHSAREDGRETAAFGKANDGAGTEPERSRKKNRKASSERKGSKIGMTDSDGARSRRGSVGRSGTVVRTEKRPERVLETKERRSSSGNKR